MNDLLWWFGRSSGLVAYLALWGTMLFGVLLGARGAREVLHPATQLALHRASSFAAVAVTAAHVLTVVGSPASPVPLLAAFVPFASAALRGPVGLGTLALWGLLLLIGTSLARARLPAAAWRAIHTLSAAGFALALAHGVYAGPDEGSAWVKGMYVVTSSALAAAFAWRVRRAMTA